MAEYWFGRSVAALMLAGGLVVASGAPAYAVDDQNCADFSSQVAAQAHFDNDPSDPDRLDENNDSQACEDYDYSVATLGAPADSAVPTGGTSTGFGGMADDVASDDSTNQVPLIVGGAALAAVGIGWTATRRRHA